MEPDPDDIAGDVFKLATRLRAAGYDDAFSMSWTRLAFVAGVMSELDLDDLHRTAIGTRVAGAEKRGWTEFERSIGR